MHEPARRLSYVMAVLAASICVTATPTIAQDDDAAPMGGYSPATNLRVPSEEPRYAAIVMDAASGEVLYQKRADSPRYPASITKIMTMYLAFEALATGRLHETDMITVSPLAASQAPTKLGLRPGDTIDVEDAMHAIGDEADSEADGIETVSKKAAAAAERAAKKLADDAKHVADSVRTPAEIMAETVDHLNGLVEQGAISWEIYRRAVGKANDEMNQSLSHDHAHASSSNAAVTRGTSAAFSAIAQSRDEMARAARLQQQQLDAQKQANDWLKKIADQTKRDPVEIRVASI